MNIYDCVNFQRPTGYETKSQYDKNRYQNNKDKAKQYSKDNRNRINERRRELIKTKNEWGGDPRFHNNILKISKDVFE